MKESAQLERPLNASIKTHAFWPTVGLAAALFASAGACGGTSTDENNDGSGGADGLGGADGSGGNDGSGGFNSGTCAEGTFDHDDDRSTTCQSWSTCQPGLYVSSEGTPTEDRSCTACPTGTFSAQQNAAACEDWVDCEAGEYELTSGDEQSDRECEACENGTFSSAENAEECEAWIDCEPGEYVEDEPDPTHDRDCMPCDSGEYSDETNAGSCIAWTVCGHPWMEDGPGTETSDTTCGDGIRQFDGVMGDLFSIAADADGNAYVVGETEADLDGDNAGGGDVFIRKYDTAGVVDWTRLIGTESYEGHPVVSMSPNGWVVVVGETEGEFGLPNPSGDRDAFAQWFTSDGTLPPGMGLQFGTDGLRDLVRDVAFNADDDMLVSGFHLDFIESNQANTPFKYTGYPLYGFSGDIRDGEPLATINTISATADGDGNFYVAGSTTGTDLDGVGAGGEDAFVSKSDFDGAHVWTRQFGTTEFDIVYAVRTDDDGNVFVTGTTGGDIDDDSATEGGAYVRMYDASGDPVWTREFGGADGARPYGLFVDDDGDVIVAGVAYGDLEGESAGGDDAFLRMYDQTGDVVWTQQFGTNEHETAQSVAINEAGHIFVAGKLGQGFVTTGAFVAGVAAP